MSDARGKSTELDCTSGSDRMSRSSEVTGPRLLGEWFTKYGSLEELASTLTLELLHLPLSLPHFMCFLVSLHWVQLPQEHSCMHSIIV